MSSSASLLMPSSSCQLEPQCSLDSGLLSPRLSAQGDGFDCLGKSPRRSSVELRRPTIGGACVADKCGHVPESAGEFDRVADAALLAKLRGSWQLAAVGKPSAAAVLADLKVQRIPDGGPEGVKGVASKLIASHGLDDTFYIMDLANVVRLYKSRCAPRNRAPHQQPRVCSTAAAPPPAVQQRHVFTAS